MHPTGRDHEKNDDADQRRRTLLDKQLDEILQTAERTHKRELMRRRLRGTADAVFGGRLASPGRLMGLGILLWLAALVTGHSMPVVTNMLLIAGLVLVGIAFFSSARNGGAAQPPERLWRGRVVEYKRDDPLAAARKWVQDLARRLRR
ncbi:MAG: hypothetical protein ACR2M0_09370 [Chloroflexia bacterium]